MYTGRYGRNCLTDQEKSWADFSRFMDRVEYRRRAPRFKCPEGLTPEEQQKAYKEYLRFNTPIEYCNGNSYNILAPSEHLWYDENYFKEFVKRRIQTHHSEELDSAPVSSKVVGESATSTEANVEQGKRLSSQPFDGDQIAEMVPQKMMMEATHDEQSEDLYLARDCSKGVGSSPTKNEAGVEHSEGCSSEPVAGDNTNIVAENAMMDKGKMSDAFVHNPLMQKGESSSVHESLKNNSEESAVQENLVMMKDKLSAVLKTSVMENLLMNKDHMIIVQEILTMMKDKLSAVLESPEMDLEKKKQKVRLQSRKDSLKMKKKMMKKKLDHQFTAGQGDQDDSVKEIWRDMLSSMRTIEKVLVQAFILNDPENNAEESPIV